ncbi:lysozyme inhibitor LprI family protein [Serratia proteamaculans]
MKKLILASLLLWPVSQVSAADCDNAETQLEMNQCANADYKKADKELNSTYQQVLKSTSGEQTALFRKAQKKWIEYRDADCQFQTFASSEGSVNSMNIGLCLKAKTEQRTKELKDMLSCPEGDVSCPL